MNTINILKIVFLFLAVWLTIINSGKIANKHGVSSRNILLQTIGIVGFVVIQFGLYL